MTFLWPWMLLGLLVLVPIVVWYRRSARRRDDRRARLAEVGLVSPDAEPATGATDAERARAERRAVRRRRRRHVAPALGLVALGLLVLALARPQATIAQPRREGTVVLAFDVSGSMAATDIGPNRLAAAKAAARSFVERQPSTIKLAVVAFGGSGLITQQPTTDRAEVLAAIDRLSPQGGTAVGRGIQTSLSAIVGRTVQLTTDDSGSFEAQGEDLGFHGSAAVILLTDGENTVDPDPLAVAQVASTAGVRVFPIGLGSPGGSVVEIGGFQVATQLDEALLKQIASVTDGEYFSAANEQELAKVYGSVQPTWTVQAQKTEITALFAVVAGFLLLVGVGLSVAWFGRVM